MSTKLVILSLLQEKPLHGYEIKHIIESHMSDWTNIAFGSIYFALDKLCAEGFISKITEEKIGKRPSRLVYKITEKGRAEIPLMLREIFTKNDRVYYSLDIALAFSRALPKEEVKGYLAKRAEILSKNLAELEKHREEEFANNKQMPKIAKSVFSHTEYHIRAELEWLKSVIDDFNKGELS